MTNGFDINHLQKLACLDETPQNLSQLSNDLEQMIGFFNTIASAKNKYDNLILESINNSELSLIRNTAIREDEIENKIDGKEQQEKSTPIYKIPRVVKG